MDIWWGHVNLTYEEGLELLKPVKLDPAFKRVYAYLDSEQIPFTILSCGLDNVIRDYLARTLGEKEAAQVKILANYCKVEDRNWIVTYRDDSPHSHDKAVAIKEARAEFKNESSSQKEQVIIFCGDGISDLSAAREADVLFARRGR
jgi:2,3-diketo-5-methylthio-1-phosphopentane phosphatase